MGLPVRVAVVYGQDNVTASLLSAGFKVYGSYFNGPYANTSAVRARFPSATIIPIAVHLAGSTGARAVDAEPGTLSSSESGNFAAVEQFLKNYKGSGKPIVYTMASWATALERYLDSVGLPRSHYFLWTAHYNGLHLCGPVALGGCGFGISLADATQYATGRNDSDVFQSYVIGGAADPTQSQFITVPGLGIKTVQTKLNAWAKYCGFPVLIVDGDYGAKTIHAVREFQSKRGQGLVVDGIVGGQTWKYLQNPPGPVKKIVSIPKKTPKPVLPSGNPVLKMGATGKAVAEMQYYLRNSGISDVKGIQADGDFGNATEHSLRHFQIWAKLTVDGVYGPETAKALSKVAVG